MKQKLTSLADIVGPIETGSYVEGIETKPIQIRWVQCQCFEIKLPDGKTLITDPFYQEPIPGKMQQFHLPFPISVDDFEACDYIIINHAHMDHYLGVKEIFQRFQPMIICNSHFAMELSKTYDIPYSHIFAFENGSSHYFESFQLDTVRGSHNPLKGITANSTLNTKHIFNTIDTDVLDSFGCLFNTNYLFSFANGFRLGFASGINMQDTIEAWRNKKPNLLMRQRMVTTTEEEYAKECMALGGQLILPMHHESSFAHNADTNLFIKKVNTALTVYNSAAQAINLKRMQWYTVSMGIQMK